jgi:malate dehydrogenase (quinone)
MHRSDSDIVLIGSGIMSASLAAMVKRLDPGLSVQVFEVADGLSQESSDGWNNAGTGHAGLCEISYTPAREADGSVKIDRALGIFEQFEHSKQFWSYAVASGMVGDPKAFIHAVPHIGFVHGADDVDFLRARHAAMVEHHFFRAMELTIDGARIGEWAPLVMEGRGSVPVAATRMERGTEVNFGQLARELLRWLADQDRCSIATGHRVVRVRHVGQAWELLVQCLKSGEIKSHRSKFVFVGAGGGSLPLLQTTGLPEVAGLGGFPIGGQWLVCDHSEICDRHNAKVYGTTPPASPSLGAPHLDIRRLDGRRQLMFGPFGSWTTKFLKNSGRWTDLPGSVQLSNISTLLRSAIHNRALVRYLVGQALQSMDHRIEALRGFYPMVNQRDWRLVEAGIRVQTIKKQDRGAVYFGTEVFRAAGGSLAALLGASPGASVSVSIALEVIKSCLPQLLDSTDGHARMKQMIPTYDEDIKRASSAGLFAQSTAKAEELLQIGR